MKKRKIVITGVSKGLGKAIAEKWISEGHIVSGCSRSIDEKEFAGSTGVFEKVDVSSAKEVEQWAQNVIQELIQHKLSLRYKVDSIQKQYDNLDEHQPSSEAYRLDILSHERSLDIAIEYARLKTL